MTGILHPTIQILIWLFLASTMPWLTGTTLAVLGIFMLVISGGRARKEFRRFARRTRWLILSLVFIYGFVTPGEALISGWGLYSPTVEGLVSGGLQALRLIILLVALSWLLTLNDRNRLLAGLLSLLKPFAWVGMDAERVSSRLWLTLYYSETVEKRRLDDWWAEAGNALDERGVETIEFDRYTVGWRDGLALSSAIVVLALLVTLT